MSGILWVATIIMTVLAFTFLVRPLFEANRGKTLVLLAIALPIFAAALYMIIGSPQVQSGRSQPLSAAASPAENISAAASEKVGSVSSMIDGLADRLKENPDDGKGWLLLARSYKHLNRIEDASYAYSKAASLGEIDPGLASLAPTNAEDSMSMAQIFGNLSLSDRAAKIVQSTDTVFIFARAASGSGVPAAVLQRPASDLPIDFLLNDSQSMVEGIKLSDFDTVVVTARISRSGNATEALQGLEAKTDPLVVADNKHLSLVIE